VATAVAARSHVVLLWMLGLYLVGLGAWSLSWPMYQDTPIMLYAAWLIDTRGAVPYRDFFDNQMPGTYAANIVVGRLSGYSEFGVRVVDLSCLAILLASTFGAMRRFGSRAAWTAAVCLGVLYLGSGEWMSLQREFLLLLPMSLAVWAALSERLPLGMQAALAGGLLGVVATIKPHAALVYPPLAWFVVGRVRRLRERHDEPTRPGVLVAWSGLAFAAPLVATALYLWMNGALIGFLDGALNYWPLYNALSGSPRPHVVLTGAARAWYVARGAIGFGGHPSLPLAIAAVLGARLALGLPVLGSPALGAAGRRQVWLLAACAAASWLSVAAGGKFYLYHWLPLNYFCILLASLGLARAGASADPRDPAPFVQPVPAWLPWALLVMLCAGLPWRYGPFYRPFAFPHARVQEIAAFLSQHLRPGDAVAPLDWTEGAVHAMLLARAPLGVPFLYDFHFYHHIESPYVQHLRQRLLDDFERTPPRFVVRVPQQAFAGPQTATEFPELIRLIAARYTKVVDGTGYEIWARADAMHAQAIPTVETSGGRFDSDATAIVARPAGTRPRPRSRKDSPNPRYGAAPPPPTSPRTDAEATGSRPR
jgi:hypothetical protein